MVKSEFKQAKPRKKKQRKLDEPGDTGVRWEGKKGTESWNQFFKRIREKQKS